MVPRRLLLLASSALFLTATMLLAQRTTSEEIVLDEPVRYCSAARTYCAQSVDFDAHDSEEESSWTSSIELLQWTQDGTYLHLRTLANQPVSGGIVVSDDGETLVLTPAAFDHTGVITILRADGTVAARSSLGDVVEASDFLAGDVIEPRWSIGRSDAAAPDRLILSLRSTIAGGSEGPRAEVEVSLADGRLLAPRRAIYPPPRVYARVASEEVPSLRLGSWSDPVCPAGPLLFGERGLLPVDPQAFLAAAIEKPVPEYPNVAVKAHIAGTAYVEVIVDEQGRVACARVNGLPFGIDAAAGKAVLRWRFRPFEWKGVAMKAIGRIALEFVRVEHEEWARISAVP